MEYDSGHCIPSRPPSTGYPNTHYDPGGVVPPHPSVPWYRITTPAGPREVLPVPKIEDTLLSDRRDETTNEPFPSAGRSLTIIPLHRRLQFGRRCRKFAAPIFSPCSTGSAPPSWTWPASVRPSFSKCFSPLSIKVCAHRHVFCNPPPLPGHHAGKLIQARSASLELMFRCRLALVGRQWPGRPST